MGDLVRQTYTIALPIILGYIVWLLKNQTTERSEAEKQQKKAMANNNRGMMLLLRIQLIQYHDKYMEQGFIPSYAYENFIEMYQVYHDLGGNGMITKMKDEIDAIRLRKEIKGNERKD